MVIHLTLWRPPPDCSWTRHRCGSICSAIFDRSGLLPRSHWHSTSGWPIILPTSQQRWLASKGLETVVLSGGVIQNRCLQQRLVQQLQTRGLSVLWPQQLPANDGGLALGQALIAAAKLMKREVAE